MDDIPRSTIERLPLYKKAMEELALSGKRHVSSNEIARRLHLSDAQIRKDLSYFGKFGVRGKGYDIESLSSTISDILGTSSTWDCILVGVGNLGRALLSYKGFQDHNFAIRAAFDVDPEKVGTPIQGCPVHHMEEMGEVLEEHSVRLAILAVPAESGEEALEHLLDHGITGILNFAPFVPEVPEGIVVESVDLSTNLQVLAYFLTHSDGSS